DLVIGIDGQIFGRVFEGFIEIHFDPLAGEGAHDPDFLVRGELGQAAGGLDGFGDGGAADVHLPAGAFDLAADVIITLVADLHGDIQAGVILGDISIDDLDLEFAGGLAFGVDGA